MYLCIYLVCGWEDGLEVCTLASELSSLGFNPDPTISCHLKPAMNCHPGVSQAGLFINVCAIPWMVVKLHVLAADISWWTLKIPRCPL